MLVVIAALAVVGVAALAMIARQYSRVSEPIKSVRDLPAIPMEPTPAVPVVADTDPPAGPGPGGTVDEGSGGSDSPVSSAESVARPPAGTGADAAPVDDATARAFRGFLAGRTAVRTFAEKYPVVADSLVDEAEGYKLGREQIKMHTFRIFELRSDRAKAAATEGIDEDIYRAVRDRYRAWLAGEDVEEPWAKTFASATAGQRAAADLGKYEPLDF